MRSDEAHVVTLLTTQYTTRMARLQAAGEIDWDEVARLSNEYEQKIARAVEEVRAKRPWWRRWF